MDQPVRASAIFRMMRCKYCSTLFQKKPSIQPAWLATRDHVLIGDQVAGGHRKAGACGTRLIRDIAAPGDLGRNQCEQQADP